MHTLPTCLCFIHGEGQRRKEPGKTPCNCSIQLEHQKTLHVHGKDEKMFHLSPTI